MGLNRAMFSLKIPAIVVTAALLLGGCASRPLAPDERAFAQNLMGNQLDTAKIQLVKGALVGQFTYKRKARPRLACRERILPPPKTEMVTVGPAAVALFNRVHFRRDLFAEDFLAPEPRRWTLLNAMLFAHEMVHVWQWQNKARTGYHPLRAAAEHGASDDPYLFDLDKTPRLLDFSYEQQASIVEEYVCCRALAPEATRTQRLHAMLRAAFPVSDINQRFTPMPLSPPWDETELSGICD